MFLDDALTLADKQAIVADAAGAKVLSIGTDASQGDSGGGAGAVGGTVAADIARGQPVKAYAKVGQAFNNLTSLDIKIQGVDADGASNPVDYISKNVLLAGLAANKLIPLGYLPPGIKKPKIRAYFDVQGANPAAGTITVGLVTDVDGTPQNDVFQA